MQKRKWNALFLQPAGVAVALLLGMLLAGCASSDAPRNSIDDAGTAVPSADSGTDADAVEVRPAQPDNPWAQPGDNGSSSGGSSSGGNSGGGAVVDPTRMLDQLSKEQREEVTELDAAASWTLARARQMRNDGQLERARDLLRDMINEMQGRRGTIQILEERISELEALYREIEALLGHAAGAIGRDLQSEYAGVVDESRQEAAKHFEDGQRLMDEGSYEDAIREFQAVLEIVRWAPYSADIAGKYQDRAIDAIRICQSRARAVESAEIDRMRQVARELEIIHRQREESRRLQDIEQLWGDALFNMNLKRYSTAERLCEQILAMDPGFNKAREMKNSIVSLRLNHFADRNLERRLDQYRRLWADWYESKIPVVGGTVEYPTGDEWLRIKARAAQGNRAIADSATVTRIRNALDTKVVPINFDETDFIDAIEYIAQRASLNIILNPDVEEDMEGVPVSLSLQNLPLKNSLTLLLDLNDLKYIIKEEGVVWITTSDDETVTGKMIVRLHDVRDLTIRVRDFPGTRIRLRGNEDGGGGGPVWEDEDEIVEPIEVDVLQDIIMENIAPDSWGDLATIQTVAGQLLVRNVASVHSQVQDFLQDLRDVSGLVVTISTRFVTIDDTYLQDFGIDWRGLGGQSPGNAAVLDDVTVQEPDFAGGLVDNGANTVPPGQAIAGLFFNDGGAGTNQDIRGRFENVWDRALGNLMRTTGGLGLQFTIFEANNQQFNLVMHALEKRRNAQIMQAPRLSAFNTQRANVTVINQVSYIRDFSVQTALSAAVADPIVDTISDGFVLDIRPTVSNDRRFVTIELQPTIATLLRPIPEFTTTLGGPGSTPVTIQLPELILQSVQTTVMCPDGGLVVVGGLKSIRDVDRESTTPLLGDIPILGTLFRRKGRSLENRSLLLVVKAVVTDLREQEERRP